MTLVNVVLVAAFLIAFLIAWRGSATYMVLILLAGGLAMTVSEIAQRDALAGHPWARSDVLDPASVWNFGLMLIVGAVAGFVIRFRHLFR